MEINNILKVAGLAAVSFVSYKVGKLCGYVILTKELIEHGDICVATLEDD